MAIRFNLQVRLNQFTIDLSGEFNKGITGIFGKSGSGKTTLLKCLAGFIAPDTGQVRINDEIYFSSEKGISVPLEERRIGMVWQETLLFPHLTVEQNVLYGRRQDCRASYYANIVDIFEIRKILNRMPANLSGGEKQRVAIARALIHEPQVLLLDEPVASLDNLSRQRIISYLKIINRDLNIPICYVSHSVSEMMFLCQEVLVLHEGRRLRFDQPEIVFINEKQLAVMEEDFENIIELPIKNMRPEEKVAELDFGGIILKVVYQNVNPPACLRLGIRAKDILIATEHLTGISARNIISAIIEKVQRTGDMVMLSCRVRDKRLWVEITPGSYRTMNLHVSQIVYLVIKSRSIRLLD